MPRKSLKRLSIPDPKWPKRIPNPNPLIFDEIPVLNEDGAVVGLRKVRADEPYIDNPKPAPLIKNPEPAPLVPVPRENPNYDPDRENVRRSDRPEEWTIVGHNGRIFVRVSEDVQSGDYLAAGDAIGVKSPKSIIAQVMKVTTHFDSTKGYAVAECWVAAVNP